MKNTKKVITAATLSAIIIGGGFAAVQSDAFANSTTKNEATVEAKKLTTITKAKSITDFSKIQYEDYTFGDFYGGFSIDYNENGTTTLTSMFGDSVSVDNEIFNVYSSEQILEVLLTTENPSISNDEVQELKRKEASTVRMDPWAMLYNEIESKNIDTKGKTFGELYDASDLKKLDTPLDQQYLLYAHYYGIETEGKPLDEIKEEVQTINASLKLKEESKDLPYDPNWLVEEEKWWVEIYGTAPVNQ
ncbi:hypothetical protein WAK64_07320 [Bacillus spongiae]|uniref:Uncharacterized protein n=1 Tax=Bacillus spongiae TaxID=2683610 RepID=A0ABU8HCI0_9BACI